MHTDALRPGLDRRRALSFPGAAIVTERELAGRLDALAERVARIRPMSNRNPDAFYEERSEVAHELRELAKQVGSRR